MSKGDWNWAGHYEYRAPILTPESPDELCEIVGRSERVRALGTRHCFSDIADSSGVLVSTARLKRIDPVNRDSRTVTIGAGVRYGDLAGPLTEQGFALENLASLPHITVVGGAATATHGSGNLNRSLASAVRSMRIVRPDGSIQDWSEATRGEEFLAAPVSLGALGIVTDLTLNVVPAFQMKQEVYDDVPFEEVARDFDEITSTGYSVSLFTDWKLPRFNQVWVIRLAAAPNGPDKWFGGTKATSPRHPLPPQDPINCTEQLGVPGAWSDRLPHFRMDFTPSSGEELQTEYFVARKDAIPAMRAMLEMNEFITPALQVTEIRMIKADRFWLSPFYGRDSVAIHFTWRKDWEAVKQRLPVIEARLAEFEVRPHWGKLFHMGAGTLLTRYPKAKDFVDLVRREDPEGKFSNEFLKRTLAL